MHRVGTTMVLNRFADMSSVDYFKKSPQITAIEVLEENEFFSAYDGVLYNKNFTKLVRCPEGKTGTLRIPATVTSIDHFAFYNCAGIEAIVVEDGIVDKLSLYLSLEGNKDPRVEKENNNMFEE